MNNDREEVKNLLKIIKKKEKEHKSTVDKKWLIEVIIIAFIVSFGMSYISNKSIPNLNLSLGIIVTLIFVLLGIIFDIVGVSVTSAEESVFHSMASRKVKAAKVAVKFKKNASKVSNFCCDVIGDICGVISGAAGMTIASLICMKYNFNFLLVNLIVAAVLSSLTIGGKALGKSFAINKSNIILYEFAKIVSIFYKG